MPAGRLDGFCPGCLWQGLFEETPAGGASEVARSYDSLRVPGLTVLGEIARGGMGIVYRARQHEPQREVALKMLLPHQVASSAAKERFRAEARAITALEHPGILPVHQVGELDGLPWFTMKLATGGSLAERKDSYRRRWREIAGLLMALADAIQFAHERGILHRDLKPANILFDEAGRAYVSDFGLAKFLDDDSTLTGSGLMLGTPSYLAPELLHHGGSPATTAADVYGLGALFYELLTGRPPLEAPNLAALLKRISEEPPARPTTGDSTVPVDLEVICLTCLKKDPAQRYPSARELAGDLRRWLEGRPILARPVPPIQVLAAWARRNPAVACLAVLLLATLLGGGLALSWQNHSLTQALQHSEQAQQAERASLRASLIAQARNLGQTDRMGRREEALALLRQAAGLPPGSPATQHLAALRAEVIAALTHADATLERRWPLPFAVEDTFSFAAFAPDLESYVFAHNGETLLLATSNQTVLARLPVEVIGSLNNLTFNADGHLLALLERTGGGSIWKVNNATRLVEFSADDGAVMSIDFHPSGKTFAVARRDGPVELRGLQGRRLAEWPVTNSFAARFSPDGSRLAIVTDSALELWRASPPQRLWTTPILQPVHRVEWDSDGRSLLAGSRLESSLSVYHAENGSIQARHNGHSHGPAQFRFHPTGGFVASAGREGSVRLWDAATGRDVLVWQGSIEALHFSRDGRRLTFAPTLAELGLLKLTPSPVFRPFKVVARTTTAPEDLLVTPDGRELITVSSLGLRRWNVAAGAQTELIPLPGRGRTWAKLSSDGGELIYGRRGSVAQRRAREGATKAAEPLPLDVAGAVFGIDQRGDWLVSVGGAVTEVWPGGRKADARRVGQALGGVEQVFSPDGRWMAIAHRAANSIHVIEVATGRPAAELAASLRAQRQSVPRAWFASDGRRLLTSNRREFQMWAVDSWRALWTVPTSARAEASGSAALSADGKFAALETEQDIYQLVEAATGRPLVRLQAPGRLLAAEAVFSPDGHKLFVAGAGPSVFEWDLQAVRRELARLALDWAE